ncbi:MAG: radical SAM protein [Candidatus Omnitrophota bacterium]
MKILLISAPYVDYYGPIKLASGRYFPLGLGYIASYLRRKSHEVLLCEPEAQGLSYKMIHDIFFREKPDVIGISSATPNFYNAVKLAKLAKTATTAVVVYGGAHASAIPEFIVQKYGEYFDYLVVGEGEETLGELAACLNDRQIPFEVPGLCFSHNGNVVRTENRKPMENLDSLPYPARDLISPKLFRPNMHNVRYKKCFTMLTSRGCPFNCSFCASYLTMGKRYRPHSADYVLGEMSFLRERYNAQQLIINDDTFTLDRGRLVEICEGMIKKRLNFKWFCFSQIAAVDKDVLKLMNEAGCYNIGFGVESASPRIMESIGKTIPLKKCAEVINDANALGIKTQAFFVFGKKGETLQEMKDTVKFALSVNPTLAFFNMLVPYPGTRDFSDFFKDVPLEQIEWKDFVAIGTKSVLKQSCGRAIDLEKMLSEANLKFYFRGKQLLHILSKIGTWHEFRAYITGAAALSLQMMKWNK